MEYKIQHIVVSKQEQITLNKYGKMRLNYLKEHKKVEYTIMLMDGTLNTHLKKIQKTVEERVNLITNKLKEKSNLSIISFSNKIKKNIKKYFIFAYFVI